MNDQIKVPFVNLGLQFNNDKKEFSNLLDEIGSSGQYIMGPHLENLEKEFASYCGTKYAIGVGNATDGLMLSMKALGIGSGDEVITATNSFISSVSSIANISARPILVDTCHCYNLNPDDVVKKNSSKTKAIMPVHLTGKACRNGKNFRNFKKI